MKLYGSTTSPYVRRIRLYLQDKKYEFTSLDIFSPEGRDILVKNNPAQKVPALLDEGHYIYDSRVIYRYLAKKFADRELSWDEENQLTLVDAVNDSLVSLFLNEKSGFDTKQDVLFFNLQHQRISKVLSTLNEYVAQGQFLPASYPSICLYALLDWINFRNLYDWQAYHALKDFYKAIQEDKTLSAYIKATDPREPL